MTFVAKPLTGGRGLTRLSSMVLSAAGFAAVLASATPARAQSLLQSLFGFGGAPRPQHTFPMRSAPHFYAPYGNRDSSGGSRIEGGGGSYRTVCVRMCDGYYFPISHGVSRSQFTRDANACQSSCGGEGRLFYQSSGDTGTDGLVDLGGRTYAMLPNAFRYRKALVQGCACKPAPWSSAELARHRRYAAEAAAAKGGAAVPAAIAAAPSAGARSASVADDDAPLSPIARPSAVEALASSDLTGEPDAPVATPPRAQRGQAAAAQRPLAAPAQPAPRAQPRPAPVKSASSGAASGAGKPVYSHDLGRFVFPGESRMR